MQVSEVMPFSARFTAFPVRRIDKQLLLLTPSIVGEIMQVTPLFRPIRVQTRRHGQTSHWNTSKLTCLDMNSTRYTY